MAGKDSQPQPPSRFWQLVKHGDKWNEYHGDPVRLIGAIVGMAVDHGVALAWLERLLQNPDNAAAEYVRNAANPHARVKLADVRRWYENSSKGQRREWCSDERHEQLMELQQLATSSAWPMWLDYRANENTKPVRCKGSDVRRVLAAHVKLALQTKGIDHPASQRKVAELANVSDAAATRATAVLVALGILRRRRPPGDDMTAMTANYYRIDATGNALRKIVGDVSPELAELAPLECHPVWRFGSGCRFDVFAQIVVGDGLATVASIAAAVNITTATVRRSAAKLAKLGLVERLDDSTLRALTVDHRAALDAAALATGNADRSRRQLERHEADRAALVQFVLRTPREFARAMRRNVRAVVAAVRERFTVNTETGEVIAVSVERERPPQPATVGSDRQHAPPPQRMAVA